MRKPRGVEKQNQSLSVVGVIYEVMSPCFVRTRQRSVSSPQGHCSPQAQVPHCWCWGHHVVSQLQTCLDEPVGECPTAHRDQGPGWVQRAQCRVQTGHIRCGAGYKPGVSMGIRPFAASPKITCGQGGGTSKAAAGAAPLQPSAQALSLPRGSRDAMCPSVPLLCPCRHALPPCTFAVSPRAQPAAAGAKLPPTRLQAGACQPPLRLSRNQRRSNGQQISMLQQIVVLPPKAPTCLRTYIKVKLWLVLPPVVLPAPPPCHPACPS